MMDLDFAPRWPTKLSRYNLNIAIVLIILWGIGTTPIFEFDKNSILYWLLMSGSVLNFGLYFTISPSTYFFENYYRNQNHYKRFITLGRYGPVKTDSYTESILTNLLYLGIGIYALWFSAEIARHVWH